VFGVTSAKPAEHAPIMDTEAPPETGPRDTLSARSVIAAADFRTTPVALVILTILAVFYTLYFAAGIILPLILALTLALLLAPAADVLNKRLHLPRMLAAVLLILLLLSFIVALCYAISVPAAGWIAKAPEGIPVLVKKLSFLRQPMDMLESFGQQAQHLMQSPNAAPAPQVSIAQNSGFGLSVLLGTRTFLGESLTFVVMLFFLLADGDTLLRRFVEILPGLSEKKRAVQISMEIERNISLYLVTITAMNLLVGIANGLAIWALGLPDPLLWGTAAFLLNYIPIVGPVAGIVTFFFVGLLSFNSIGWSLVPPGIYLLVHIIEGQTITPILLARRFTLNPVLVIGTLMFWDWLWGIPGALLAVPMLGAMKIICDHIEVLTPLGHLLGNEASIPPRAQDTSPVATAPA
jgi:predicted PurR-regulated permease PerM